MDASQKQEAIKVLSDPETVKKVTEKAFADIDTDHSGFTERGEPAKACKPLSKECGAPEPSKDEIDESLKAIDQNGDGKISKKELGDLIAFLFKLMVEELKNN